MNIKIVGIAFLAASVLTACESNRTIPVKQANGKMVEHELNCIGITRKHEQKGIDYDLSLRNTIISVIFPPIPAIFTLHHETFCPIADTSHT